jgi:tetratricopeptide (TPR) repeat protein
MDVSARQFSGIVQAMRRVEKTVFISYRRTNIPWALAIFQYLTQNGYDVFFDYTGLASGDFETVILENIRARAHFLVVLTPSALERCAEPGDWLRREIEAAIDTRRNIVPLMLEGFDFDTPTIAGQLTGKLAGIRRYQALSMPAAYFFEAMGRLRDKYLSAPLDAVLHPASSPAQEVAAEQKTEAETAPAVQEEELTAQQWFERGYNAVDLEEKWHFYSQAIRLKPDYAEAYNNRGNVRDDKGDREGAIQDYNEAIRLKPDYADAFYNRGFVRRKKGDVEGAIQDYNEALRLKPDYASAFNNRGNARRAKGDLEGAMQDYSYAIRLKPDFAQPFNNRGIARRAKGDLHGAIQDYSDAIRLKPNFADPFYNRGVARRDNGDLEGAIQDYQKYLDLGGGLRDGDQSEVEETIRALRKKLEGRSDPAAAP